MAILPSGTESDHVEEWNCCGQSLIPIEAASSGVGKVISTGLLLVLLEVVAESFVRGIVMDAFVTEKERHRCGSDGDGDDEGR